MYRKYFKRFFDIIISFFSIIILSPMLVLLAVIGAFAMSGNPFFVQERPGKDEKIFKLIKFRTMNCRKDASGNLLPDEQRLTSYGRALRKSSLDEVPELFNILKGDMSLVGPRPLLVRYLPRYSQEQRRRHEVRPGLTGYAQSNGRNAISWEEKFRLDVWYVDNLSFITDVKIIFSTVRSVLRRDGISQQGNATMEEFMGV